MRPIEHTLFDGWSEQLLHSALRQSTIAVADGRNAEEAAVAKELVHWPRWGVRHSPVSLQMVIREMRPSGAKPTGWNKPLETMGALSARTYLRATPSDALEAGVVHAGSPRLFRTSMDRVAHRLVARDEQGIRR